MNLSDMRDQGLRTWVDSYQRERLESARSARRSTEDMKRLWRGYTEGDWGALRELVGPEGLRARANLAGIMQADVDQAILSRIDSLPPVRQSGVEYHVPYSLGLEVAALRELLPAAAAPVARSRVEVQQLDFTEPDRPEEPHAHRGR